MFVVVADFITGVMGVNGTPIPEARIASLVEPAATNRARITETRRTVPAAAEGGQLDRAGHVDLPSQAPAC